MRRIQAGFIVAGLLIYSLAGCAMFRPVNYSMAFRNIGEKTIWVYPTLVGKQHLGAGILSKDIMKGSSCYNQIPERINIKWRNGREETIEKTVEVKKNIPSRFHSNRDCIIFNIDDNDDIILSFQIETGEYQWEEIDSQGNKVDFSQGKR